MELNRYTEQALNALSGAQDAARSFGHSFVGSEHLLMGLIKCGDNTSKLLEEQGITADAASPYIDTVVGGGRSIFTDSFGNTQSVKRILELALYEAKSSGSELIGTEHILLSIMRERDSLGARIIDTLCRSKEALRTSLLGENEANDTARAEDDRSLNEPVRIVRRHRGLKSASKTPVADAYSRDLTALAEAGKIDPVIGRESEIMRIIQILCRRTKNNPVLIGEPGVGKSAIAEGLALRISEGKVPPALSDARILELDLGAMIAGTKYRGEFEERLKEAIDELSCDSDSILFIDEIHTLVGAGAGEGSTDAANLLKPALARGDLRIIGATTIDEYRTYIEKDAALERRFSPILVCEPSPELTVKILTELRSRYEAHHNAVIDMSAINAAVELSERFIADRQLPDKAIDLLDEACSHAGLKEGGTGKAEDLKSRIEQAAQKGEFELAKKLRDEQKSSEKISEKVTVTDKDVEEVIAERTGIDVGRMSDGTWLEGIEDRLSEAVFGQNDAIRQISSVLRRSAAGLGDAEKPFASFIIAGPSGCGKNTLVGRLADTLFNGSVIRLNGGELTDDLSAVRLMGAPYGYKDADKGGSLAQFIRIHPVSVVSISNAELCSPKVFALLSDIMGSGKAEDGKGRTIGFRNAALAILVDVDYSLRSVGFSTSDSDGDIIKAVSRLLPVSLVSSADALVPMKNPDADALLRIAEYKLRALAERVSRRGVNVSFSDEAVSAIVSTCGGNAESIDRLISIGVEDAVSIALLKRIIDRGDSAVCDFADGEYIIRKV